MDIAVMLYNLGSLPTCTSEAIIGSCHMNLLVSLGCNMIPEREMKKEEDLFGITVSFPVALVLVFLSHGETVYDGRSMAHLIVPGKRIEEGEREREGQKDTKGEREQEDGEMERKSKKREVERTVRETERMKAIREEGYTEQ